MSRAQSFLVDHGRHHDVSLVTRERTGTLSATSTTFHLVGARALSLHESTV